MFLKTADLGLQLAALGATILVIYSPEAGLSVPDYSVDFLSSHVELGNAIIIGLTLVAWHLCFKIQSLYFSVRLSNRNEIMERVAKSTAASAVVLFFAGEIAGWGKINMVSVVFFWAVSFLIVLAFRLVVFYASHAVRRHGINQKTLLILGGGERARRIIENLNTKSELGYRILGYVDSDAGFSGHEVEGVKWLGKIEDLPSIISSTAIDEVMVALPIKSQYTRIKRAVAVLEEQGIVTHVVSDFFPHQLARVQTHEFQGLPLLSLHSAPPFCWKTDLKRLIDIVVSASMLIGLLPVYVAIIFWIKFDSEGPIFFFQERMGYNKRRFRMIKFRTMCIDAEERMKEIEHLNEKDGAIFKIKNDPRITKAGRILRKFSLDELPQLYNVLVGDMSLVGPRPLSIRDAMRLETGSHKRRFSVRPGLTCLWQISGRSDLSFEEWMKLDLEYIDHWSLYLDGVILLRTVPAVMTARGAV